MSAFRVYGRSKFSAIARARKIVGTKKNGVVLTPSEWDTEVDKKADEIFEKMVPVAISGTYDAPQFCVEYIAVAKQEKRLADLHIRALQAKKDKHGSPILRKGKEVMSWQPWDV